MFPTRRLHTGEEVVVAPACGPTAVEEALHITQSCRLAMEEKGIFQWTKDYPSCEALNRDFEEKQLFLCRLLDKEGQPGKAIGTVSISLVMDDEYKHVQWLTKGRASDETSVYVHRLATYPSMQRRGVATVLMDFVEARSKNLGFPSVRLDTFSLNRGNQAFYEKRGYVKLQEVFFVQQSPHPFHAFEFVFSQD